MTTSNTGYSPTRMGVVEHIDRSLPYASTGDYPTLRHQKLWSQGCGEDNLFWDYPEYPQG